MGADVSADETETIVGKGGCELPLTRDWQAVSQIRPIKTLPRRTILNTVEHTWKELQLRFD
jgi:hypothetical protein